MAGELTFKDAAAAEYDRAFAHVAAYFTPFLLRAARVASGMRVLDIATGTGLSAEAAVAVVGPSGDVTATDLSPAMVEKARERAMFRASPKPSPALSCSAKHRSSSGCSMRPASQISRPIR
jgi:predicted TPR repeat methyltransferase